MRTNCASWSPRATGAAPGELPGGNTTDTALITALLAGDPDQTLEVTALEVLPYLRGAFSLVFIDEHTLYAARDPHGIRPLVLGRLERGWVVASETAALDIVGAVFVREIEPGELVAIDADGPQSRRFAAASPRPACSSTSTSPARTPRSAGGWCTRSGSRWDGAWRGSTRSTQTW
jgi:asparagine synthetase B (glutamine-hydrolysing)